MPHVGNEGKLYIFMKKILKNEKCAEKILRYVRPSRLAGKKEKESSF